jgi:hypothetical protein
MINIGKSGLVFGLQASFQDLLVGLSASVRRERNRCTFDIWLLGATGLRQVAIRPRFTRHVPCTMHPRYHARPQLAHSRLTELSGPRDPPRPADRAPPVALDLPRRVAVYTGHRDTAAPMPYKEDRPPRTSYMPHNSTHPAPTWGNSAPLQRCSAAAPASGSLHTPPRRRDVINKVDVSSDLVEASGSLHTPPRGRDDIRPG